MVNKQNIQIYFIKIDKLFEFKKNNMLFKKSQSTANDVFNIFNLIINYFLLIHHFVYTN
jgi:hypothetical protein